MEKLCPKEIVCIILDIVKKRKLRAIFSSKLPLHQEELLDDCFLIEECPHDWLFPQMSCLIHSGGIGTVAAGLKAGKPMLILPFANDQFFWGRRIFDLQLGPKHIPLRSITHEHFDQTLNDLISNKIYYNHACHLPLKLAMKMH